MDITKVDQNLPVAPSPVDSIPVEKTAENRDVVQAVKALNGAELLGENNELTFQRDAVTRRMVIRVVNRKTKEVISQVPPEYVLSLAATLRKPAGG
jgi:flagellar protein FlaG